MRIVCHDAVAAFARHAGHMLAGREAENCFLLGSISELSAGADRPEAPRQREPLMWAIQSADGAVAAAAMMSRPDASSRAHPLVVTAAPQEAVSALVRHLRQAGTAVPGVSGPAPTADAFADAWCGPTGQERKLSHALGLHRLTRVVPPPRATAVVLRPAAKADAELLVAWADAFFREVGEPETPEFCRRVVAERIAEDRVFLWCDPEPAAMAGWAGRTPNGVRINFVYTPPENRRRGYATACAAALSRRLLESGRTFCFLFTDLHNPTSNHIYRSIGYEHVADFKHITFGGAGGRG